MLRRSADNSLDSSASRYVSAAPVIILALSLTLMAMPVSRGFYDWLVSENRPVELLTFLALLLAAYTGLRLALHYHRLVPEPLISGFLTVFSVGLLFVALEEVSWGQSLFDFETPAHWSVVNKQGETNLHNLPVVNEVFEILRLAFGVGGLMSIWLFQRGVFAEPLQRSVDLLAAPPVLRNWFLIIAILAALDLMNIFVPVIHRPVLLKIAAALPEVLELLIGIAAWFYMRLAWFAATRPNEHP